MAIASTATKFTLWTLRAFEWVFAVIALGVFAYFVSVQRDLDVHVLRETTTPLVASVLAVVFTTFTLVVSFFNSKNLQYLAAFLDFAIFVIYITSAGLYRHNFHTKGWKNPLQEYLLAAKRTHRLNNHHDMINGLVKLGGALIIIQLIFYFFTWLIGGWVAYRSDVVVKERTPGEKRTSWFSSRSSKDSARNGAAAADAPAVQQV